MAYCGAVTCLPIPESGKTGILNVQDKILPSARFGKTHITNKYWGRREGCSKNSESSDSAYTDGRNVREVVLETLEHLVDTIGESKGAEDTQALTMIISLLRNIIDDKGIDMVGV